LKSIKGSIKKIVAFNLLFFFLTSPLCPVVNLTFPDYTHIGIGQHELQLSEVLGRVPSNASILTQDNIFTQVSDRLDAYVVPYRFLQSSIANIAIGFVNETLDYRVEYVLMDSKTDSVSASLVVSLLATKPQFKIIVSRDNGTILLYQRKP
jgi:hypothetical protein